MKFNSNALLPELYNEIYFLFRAFQKVYSQHIVFFHLTL